MVLSTRLKGLKQLESRLKTLVHSDIVNGAIRRTQDELKSHQAPLSLPFVYHVFREKLRDALRNTRK